jgi:hypothetical protein
VSLDSFKVNGSARPHFGSYGSVIPAGNILTATERTCEWVKSYSLILDIFSRCNHSSSKCNYSSGIGVSLVPRSGNYVYC